MTRDAFDIWRKRRSASGQRQLADTIRTLVYRTDEALFDRLDLSSDAQFLHPVLFAYFTDPSPPISLAQALYGLTPAMRRPSSIRIQTDAAGCACLGLVGTVETDAPSAKLHFGRTNGGSPYGCTSEEAPLPFRLRSPLLVPGTAIEVTTDVHPLFRRLYGDPGAQSVNTAAAQRPQGHLLHLMVALGLIRAHCASVWDEIAAFTRLIVLYSASAPNSFAALSAHGAIFCNVREGEDEVALLEDVAHQAAHVIFNAFSHDPRTLLAVNPETAIQDMSPGSGETRSFYVVLHALFTYTLICRVLAGVHNANVLPERQAHEVLGRLGFTLVRFAADLALLDMPAVYTDAGRRCYSAFSAEFERIKTRHGALVADFGYGNQPYVFDYLRFVEANGWAWPVACSAVS